MRWEMWKSTSLQGLPCVSEVWKCIFSGAGGGFGVSSHSERILVAVTEPRGFLQTWGGKVGVTPVPRLLWGDKKASLCFFFPSISSVLEQAGLGEGALCQGMEWDELSAPSQPKPFRQCFSPSSQILWVSIPSVCRGSAPAPLQPALNRNKIFWELLKAACASWVPGVGCVYPWEVEDGWIRPELH